MQTGLQKTLLRRAATIIRTPVDGSPLNDVMAARFDAQGLLQELNVEVRLNEKRGEKLKAARARVFTFIKQCHAQEIR